MKKFLLTMCVAFLSVIAFAQTNMVVVVLKDGTEVKYLATDIDSIRIDNFTAVPADQTGLRFWYHESTMTATVYGSVNYDVKEIKIPSQVYYDGNVYDVTTIEGKAFAGCTSLKSIEIPNSVTEIGSSAFDDCTSLESIEIPNSVTEIGDYAFNGCTSLTSIEIPNSVTEIGWYAFMGCSSLTSIEIPESVTYIGGYAFADCSNLKTARVPVSLKDEIKYVFFPSTCEIEWYGGAETTAVPADQTGLRFEYDESTMTATVSGLTDKEAKEAKIPSKVLYDGKVYDVTKIGFQAFLNCESLTSIEIPNSVTEIGRDAFTYCTSLTSIEIPESVTTIGSDAFLSCTSLTSIEIPNSVTEIGSGAFEGCSKLKTARVPVSLKGKVWFPSTCEIEWYGGAETTAVPADQTGLLFDYDQTAATAMVFGLANKELKESKIPSKVLYDGNEYSVTSIRDGAFQGCSLTSIEIGNSVTTIGDYAFRECTSLTSIEIPNSVASIGESAFSDCGNLTSIEIGNSVTTIGSSAFAGCTSLTSIEIPNSVTTIGVQAFAHCSNLTSIEIGNSVTEIGIYAFAHCESLTSIVLGNSVTTIGSEAFYGCTSLTSIEIPNSVTEIGLYAFWGCSKLKTARVPKNCKYDSYYSFPNECTIIKY